MRVPDKFYREFPSEIARRPDDAENALNRLLELMGVDRGGLHVSVIDEDSMYWPVLRSNHLAQTLEDEIGREYAPEPCPDFDWPSGRPPHEGAGNRGVASPAPIVATVQDAAKYARRLAAFDGGLPHELSRILAETAGFYDPWQNYPISEEDQALFERQYRNRLDSWPYARIAMHCWLNGVHAAATHLQNLYPSRGATVQRCPWTPITTLVREALVQLLFWHPEILASGNFAKIQGYLQALHQLQTGDEEASTPRAAFEELRDDILEQKKILSDARHPLHATNLDGWLRCFREEQRELFGWYRRRGGTVPDDAFQGNWRAWLKYRRDLWRRKISGVDIAKELEHTAPPAGDVARILLRRLDVLELWIAHLEERRRRLGDLPASMVRPTSSQATPLAGAARDDRANPDADSGDPAITADREKWRTDAALREEFAGNEAAWLAYAAAERAGLLPPGQSTKRW